jgi:DNA-binding IclR family transcriptional regulator
VTAAVRKAASATGRTTGAQSIRRAIEILRMLAAGQEQGVRLADVVQGTGLNRPTAHRILKVLAEEGLVEQDPHSRRYLVGREVSLLGLARTVRTPVRAVAEPYLAHLADRIGDTVFLTVRSGADSIGVDRKMGAYPVQVRAIEIGVRRPLGVGVAGVMLLACMPVDEATAITRANAQRLARHQLTPARVLERVRAARTRGYAYTDAGVVKGTRALSVPVYDAAGEAQAAISIAAIADRLSAARGAEVAALAREQAALITRRLVQLARHGAKAAR